MSDIVDLYSGYETVSMHSLVHVPFPIPFFFLSVGPVANATDALQPSRLVVLTPSSPACLDVRTFAASYPHVHNDVRDPSSERWNYVGEN